MFVIQVFLSLRMDAQWRVQGSFIVFEVHLTFFWRESSTFRLLSNSSCKYFQFYPVVSNCVKWSDLGSAIQSHRWSHCSKPVFPDLRRSCYSKLFSQILLEFKQLKPLQCISTNEAEPEKLLFQALFPSPPEKLLFQALFPMPD